MPSFVHLIDLVYITDCLRCLSVTPSLQDSEGWLSKLLMVRKIDTGKESHSRLLSDTEKVFELYSKWIDFGSQNMPH